MIKCTGYSSHRSMAALLTKVRCPEALFLGVAAAIMLSTPGRLFGAAGATQTLPVEDRAARVGLPEFQWIEAASRDELTLASDLSANDFTQWRRSQGDDGARRYSALRQINRSNVKFLKEAWTYHSKDGADNVQCTPIIVEGIIYAPTAGRAMVAVDSRTGKELWRYAVEKPMSVGLEDAPARRGLAYWPGEGDQGGRILFGSGKWLYALDPSTGKLVAGFGEQGRAALPTGATAGPVVWKDVVMTTGLYGDVFAYGVNDGRLRWRFHTVPNGTEAGSETWSGSGQRWYANCWGGLSVDDQRGIAFIAVGAPQPNFVGIDRHGENLFGNCVLALDIATGRKLWHFQNVRHDIWDLDVSAPPNLVTITRDGRRIDAVAAVSKAGILLLLDRVSGKPIFPFRLRRAPTSTLPGEKTAPYQPDPELPEQISSEEFRLSDVTQRTPEAHDFVVRTLERATFGRFEPFSEGKPNVFIGTRGGGEWSGAAVDVPTGRLYVTSNRIPSMITVFGSDELPRDPKYPASVGEKLYGQTCAACHGPARMGNGMAPPLVGLKARMSENEVLALLKSGRAAMPPAVGLDDQQKSAVIDFLFRRNQPPSRSTGGGGEGTGGSYTFDGFKFLLDQEGYPGINPPWGLLNCYDLNTGKILWRVPLGEYGELTAKGIPKTGAQNLGGATVTAGGLVFCAGTADRKLRAFDSDTGEELWSATLPWAGYAAPAVYAVDGRQFVVIAATGGGKVGGPTGDAYVAFALDAPVSTKVHGGTSPLAP